MNFINLTATVFNIGKLPIAPGTWSSILSLVIWFFIPLSYIVQISIIILLLIIGKICSQKYSKKINKKDPSEIVIDEVVGMCISVYMLPHNLFLFFIAFLLFRFFDIFKPSIIYHVQRLPNGWGIMLDDVLAGFFTLSIMIGILFVL